MLITQHEKAGSSDSTCPIATNSSFAKTGCSLAWEVEGPYRRKLATGEGSREQVLHEACSC